MKRRVTLIAVGYLAILCRVRRFSLHNAVRPDRKLEQQYLQIIKHYEPEDVSRLSQLLVHVIIGLECEPHDFLGSIFMEMNLGSKHLKQFFTP
ncbi:hypothetical protein C6H65_12065 [Photorhabdus luminescens]|nr:hypothetical protein C6H65_12065 [Photorhabdus luminescens]